jgi:NADH-quinone oxidoreductase subunit A
MITARIIRPNRPNIEKNTPYECGEEPIGSAWGKFNIRFYVIAILFLLFEVEVIFLFPWATIMDSPELKNAVQGNWSMIAFTEAFIFVFLLSLGLAFAWKKGYLNWDKPDAIIPRSGVNIPAEKYEAINQKYA